MMKIKIIKFNENLIIPKRAHYNDAGLDCYAPKDIVLEKGEMQIVNLSFGLEIPNGYMATIRPRSSMNAKGILTQIGTIDSGYRGEIKAILVNLTNKALIINSGDKICQIVIEPVILADLVENLGNERGDGGFGSTGK